MSRFDEPLDRIRSASTRVKMTEFARISGVPYTTLRDLAKKDFKNLPLETFEKLTDAADVVLSDGGAAA